MSERVLSFQQLFLKISTQHSEDLEHSENASLNNILTIESNVFLSYQ